MDRVEAPRFEVVRRGSDTRARLGRLRTPHGVVETPAFLPVGTHGAVRALDPDELHSLGVQAVLANTYHLYLRPGEELIAELGGLHPFMGWDRVLLTDSGGFQVFSLDHLCRCTEEGVRFRSPVDGSRHLLTPEECIRIQERLGADLIVTLDQFEPIRIPGIEGDEARTRALLERTLRWASRCRAVHARDDQLLFGITQGGGFPDLRRESAERTAELGFGAFALGGLGVGEPPSLRGELLESALSALPDEAPRHLMGFGMPEDLVATVELGLDLFDCVVPTRHARHGSVFTRTGTIQLRNSAFRSDPLPPDPDCGCRVCQRFSRAYLRHLLAAKEMLGPRLLTYHNLAYFMNLLGEVRSAISEDRFSAWARAWRADYKLRGPRSATHSAA